MVSTYPNEAIVEVHTEDSRRHCPVLLVRFTHFPVNDFLHIRATLVVIINSQSGIHPCWWNHHKCHQQDQGRRHLITTHTYWMNVAHNGCQLKLNRRPAAAQMHEWAHSVSLGVNLWSMVMRIIWCRRSIEGRNSNETHFCWSRDSLQLEAGAYLHLSRIIHLQIYTYIRV